MQAAVLGATGYTGIELVRLIKKHPKVEPGILTSENFSGEPISRVYPHLRNMVERRCESFDLDRVAENSDLVFAALPHKVSANIVPGLLARGLKVIDLSGDFRYRDARLYRKWYQTHSNPELLEEAVYGLAEIKKGEIKSSRLIANPGCYPTSSLLAIHPLIFEGIIDSSNITIDAKSGITGAGREATRKTHFCEIQENFQAYNVGSHRHRSEIAEKLRLWNDKTVEITFTPHLLPVNRGILSTIYADPAGNIDREDILEIYRKFYRERPFIRVLDEKNPQLKYVRETNFCDLSVNINKNGKLIIISALDNLLKGAAGQAIQNMNLLFDWPEKLGLYNIGPYN